MQFTTLSRLIRESFEEEMRCSGVLLGQTDEPLLADRDAHAIVSMMRDPARPLDEQGAILAAVIRRYRKAPTPSWAAILLEILSPTLVATSTRFTYAPIGIDEEDVQQQVVVEALHAAGHMRLPEQTGFTLPRLTDWIVSRTARMLLRNTRAETESLEQVDAHPERRIDPEHAFLLELARGSTPGADLALLYLSKVERMTARELAIEMGVSLNWVLNRRRRARYHLKGVLPAEKQHSRSERAAAA
jgi:DNA-directed RNA polymerase specialized sigma24 family protein